MNVRELIDELENYGDHLEVVIHRYAENDEFLVYPIITEVGFSPQNQVVLEIEDPEVER